MGASRRAIPPFVLRVSAITIHCTAVLPIAVGKTNNVDDDNDAFVASSW